MMYTISYHPLVLNTDIVSLDSQTRERIASAIRRKLKTHPKLFGKSLRRSLHGVWKLRVGDYRVLYIVSSNIVIIWGILHRSIAYKHLLKRMNN